jgi:hypothetical protein
MRPVPQRGTGGARGGLYIIRKKVFYRAIISFIFEIGVVSQKPR